MGSRGTSTGGPRRWLASATARRFTLFGAGSQMRSGAQSLTFLTGAKR